MDRDKPLWDMYLIDGPHPGCAVIVRMHHCIADGIALSGVMLSLTDSAHQDDIEPPLPARSGAASAALRLAVGLAREGLRTLAHPRHGIELADGLAADLRALAKLILTSADAPSVLKSDHGAAREVAWSRPLSLERIKAIARTQEATVNDVLLTAVSGALRGHLLAQGEEPHEIRALVPVNLRAPEDPARHELGNRFGLVYLSLPVELSSRRERLKELKRRMDEIKHSPEGAVSYALLETLGMTPPELESRLLDIFTNKATAVMTNVPGPRETVYLAGAPLRTVLVWAPTAGSVGTSVSIFSYSGAVTIGLLTHASLETEPQSILDRLEREVAAMDRLAPTTNGRHADPPPGQSR
jgi:WS/DGAT/MGAT family acyltransferase